ncbi:uncharacterized protein LOC135462155 [Liolophura sinensis]|uniref:uncharacterized protein LOC135462155 n=1 Tax=Liolophura sinensis TaxID=3198878 RepID=UPI003159160D
MGRRRMMKAVRPRDYDDEADRTYQVVDPGTFRYNKRLLVISLPCFLVVLSLTGELLLCIVGIGVTMVSVLHTYEEHERSLVVFMLSFLMAQITILYSVLPLVWVSLANLLLIGLINGYVVMTGCWLVIQLPAFRLQAMDSLPFIEKALFSFYPGFCVLLWTWAMCFVFVPVLYSPFLLLVFGFVVLQLFLVPAESSFCIPKLAVKDAQIVDPVFFGLLAAMFAIGPSVVHVCVTVLLRHSYVSVLEPLVQEAFILSASVFLTTFLGLRKFFDHLGWSYDL